MRAAMPASCAAALASVTIFLRDPTHLRYSGSSADGSVRNSLASSSYALTRAFQTCVQSPPPVGRRGR